MPRVWLVTLELAPGRTIDRSVLAWGPWSARWVAERTWPGVPVVLVRLRRG